MSDLAQVEIERDVADAAARRAAEEGLTVTAYISLLLRRSFEHTRYPRREFAQAAVMQADTRGCIRILAAVALRLFFP